MGDCIFCKIVKGEIPCEKIWEDEFSLAFLDITPLNPGHVLLIPKKHTETLLDTDDLTLERLLPISKRIAAAMMFALNKDNVGGFNVGINNFKAAGQLVPHFHIHIMPRKLNDGFKHWEGKRYKNGEANKIAENIRKAL